MATCTESIPSEICRIRQERHQQLMLQHEPRNQQTVNEIMFPKIIEDRETRGIFSCLPTSVDVPTDVPTDITVQPLPVPSTASQPEPIPIITTFQPLDEEEAVPPADDSIVLRNMYYEIRSKLIGCKNCAQELNMFVRVTCDRCNYDKIFQIIKVIYCIPECGKCKRLVSIQCTNKKCGGIVKF